MSASVVAGPELVVLERGPLHMEVVLRPFAFTLRRAGRRLLRGGGAWVAAGDIRDHFIALTEGIIAREELAPHERVLRAELSGQTDTGVTFALTLRGGRSATLRCSLPSHHVLDLELVAEGKPLRLALDWDRRSEERLHGLGARHGTQLDQAGRCVQLGADRRYTGPDCPAEMLAEGGIPQGDCAPLPWLDSSRGYAVWVRTDATCTNTRTT
jgi:hypothetical protein